MNPIQYLPRAAAIPLVLAAACSSGPEGDTPAEANKKAYEAASKELQASAGIIAAYLPHLDPPDGSDKYAPKRRGDLEKAAAYAADEIRHAANIARQRIQRVEAPGVKDLLTALGATSAACTDAKDEEAVAKCKASTKALSAAIEKTEAAAVAAGVTAKFPRFTPEAINDEAKKSIATFLQVRGPGPAEKTYIEKRADPKVSVADLISACQAAAAEAEATSTAFEKADEPLQVISAMHKMAVDSQCGGLSAADTVRKDLEECRKKPKSQECSLACGKAKTIVDAGVPAAALAPIEKEHAELCEKK